MTRLDSMLSRWIQAGLLDEDSAARIRDFETDRTPDRGFRWPALIAVSFGALMVGGGVLLFVAAHWDRLAPSARFLSVLSMVAVFHLAGVWFTGRMPRLATAFHGLGSGCLAWFRAPEGLGAGIPGGRSDSGLVDRRVADRHPARRVHGRWG
jgi:uncharacterized membrane protein